MISIRTIFLKSLRAGHNRRARLVLYPVNPTIGTLFTSPPWIVFLAFSLSSLVALVLPSFLLHLALIPIPTNQGEWSKVGFMQRFNWGFNYLTILPLIFALAALASRSFKKGLLYLLRRPPTIRSSANKTQRDYLNDFSAQTAIRTRYLFAGCLVITIILTFIDSFHNLHGYAMTLLHHQPFHSDELDWMNAAYIPANKLWSYRVAPLANLFFYLLALFFQGCVICLGLFWISAFWIHSRVFADLMLKSKFDYRFVPWEEDPDQRLGLKPIGFVFSTFLILSVLLQIYVYLHRLQVMHVSPWPYFIEVAKTFDLWDHKAPVDTLGKALSAWWPLNKLKQVNPGMVLLILAGPFLSITIGWWPIVRLGHYIEYYRQGLIKRYRTETLEADAKGEVAKAAAIKAKIKGLSEACIWPNGYAVGWGIFSLLLILEVSALFPALLPVLIVSGALLKMGQFFFKGKAKPTA